MADKLFPVVPDTGTLKAARLATEITGDPGRWVRLDCQHVRHVQQPVEPGQLLECPTCPPSVGGALPAHAVELTVDAGEDVGRIEVRDQETIPGSGKVVAYELRQA